MRRWCSVPADVTNDAWLSRRKLSLHSHVAKCGLSCPLLLLSSNNYWQVTTKCWNNSFRAASCSHERTGCKYWTCTKKLRWVDTSYLDTFNFFKADNSRYNLYFYLVRVRSADTPKNIYLIFAPVSVVCEGSGPTKNSAEMSSIHILKNHLFEQFRVILDIKRGHLYVTKVIISLDNIRGRIGKHCIAGLMLTS